MRKYIPLDEELMDDLLKNGRYEEAIDLAKNCTENGIPEDLLNKITPLKNSLVNKYSKINKEGALMK
ncbi:MAG: hypothetical protein NZM04_02515 [Methylacidiphilales bacterium]|nr:hypothetical protein [Candidatus Methylacidiphilales bacterium]